MALFGRGPLSKLVGSSIGLVKEYRADQKERKAAEGDQQQAGLSDGPVGGGGSSSPLSVSSPSSPPYPQTQYVELDANQQPPPPDYYIAELGSGQYSHFPSPVSHENSRQNLSPDYQEEIPIDPETLAQDFDEARQAATETKNDDPATTTTSNVDDLIQVFIARHNQHHPSSVPSPYPQSSSSSPPLSAPVLIPQRRPNSQHRGFVRAYSPVLAAAGIPQDTWLDFLDTLETSIQANSWFKVANAAVTTAHVAEVAAAGFSPITFLVAMAVDQGLEAGRKVYLHGKQNSVLDAANERFFGKKGVYVMVVRYKPEGMTGGNGGDDGGEEVDLNGNVAKMVDRREAGRDSKWDTWMRSSPNKVKSFGQEMPPVAPLVFPEMTGEWEERKGKKRSGGLKGFGEFLEDYHDRQAQAKFEAKQKEVEGEEGAGSMPQVPRKEFASSFSDPNHAVNKGGLLSMATGGKINPQLGGGLIGGRLGSRGGRMGVRRGGGGGGGGGGLIGTIGSSFGVDLNMNRGPPKPGQNLGEWKESRGLKGMMKEDALYLMVVNMPSPEEMERALAVVNEKAKVEGHDM